PGRDCRRSRKAGWSVQSGAPPGPRRLPGTSFRTYPKSIASARGNRGLFPPFSFLTRHLRTQQWVKSWCKSTDFNDFSPASSSLFLRFHPALKDDRGAHFVNQPLFPPVRLPGSCLQDRPAGHNGGEPFVGQFHGNTGKLLPEPLDKTVHM